MAAQISPMKKENEVLYRIPGNHLWDFRSCGELYFIFCCVLPFQISPCLPGFDLYETVLTIIPGLLGILAPELRTMIYEFVFELSISAEEWYQGTHLFDPSLRPLQIRAIISRRRKSDNSGPYRRTALLLTNRFIYNEALPIMAKNIPYCDFTLGIEGSRFLSKCAVKYHLNQHRSTLMLSRNVHPKKYSWDKHTLPTQDLEPETEQISPYVMPKGPYISEKFAYGGWNSWVHLKAIRNITVTATHLSDFFTTRCDCTPFDYSRSDFMMALVEILQIEMDIQTLNVEVELDNLVMESQIYGVLVRNLCSSRFFEAGSDFKMGKTKLHFRSDCLSLEWLSLLSFENNLRNLFKKFNIDPISKTPQIQVGRMEWEIHYHCNCN